MSLKNLFKMDAVQWVSRTVGIEQNADKTKPA